MQRTSKNLLVLTVAGPLALLVASVWPGFLPNLLLTAVLLFLALSPAIVTGICVLLFILYQQKSLYRRQRRPIVWPWRRLAATAMIVLVTIGLVVLQVPRQIAFAGSRSAFDTECARGIPTDHRVVLNKRFGIFWVDEYAADARGGTYFRVYQGADGIGPDTMSYGFVKNPNQQGTPFGAAHYFLCPLGGQWYWFGASNDWF